MKYRLVGLAWLGMVSLCGKPAEKDIVDITDLGLRLLPIKAGKFQMGDDRVADIVKPYLYLMGPDSQGVNGQALSAQSK